MSWDDRKLICRYKDCPDEAIKGSLFCEPHSKLGPGGRSIPDWIEKMITELPAGLVVTIVVEVFKKIIGVGSLSDATTRQVKTLIAKLEKETSVKDERSAIQVIREAKAFFEAQEDTRFLELVNQVLRDSGKYAEIGEEAGVLA
jgi:hypothetical protein